MSFPIALCVILVFLLGIAGGIFLMICMTEVILRDSKHRRQLFKTCAEKWPADYLTEVPTKPRDDWEF